MSLTRAEQETVIRRAADEGTWDVWTADPVIMRRLERADARRPGEARMVASTSLSQTWRIPRSWVAIRPPRQVSDEQREQMRQRLAGARP